jgi:chromosome segregation ATPase
MEPDPAAAPPWLAELEERVRQAVAEIGRLRGDNRRLERELAKLKKAGAAGGEAAAAWERERSEVRERVERLARHLEELLGEAAQSPAAGA